MLNRCTNVKHPAYHRYGGRGIAICERWDSFENFYADMGERPEGTSLDRIDSNGDYAPGNCRWATIRQQANNRTTNLRVAVGNERLTIAEASRSLGVNCQTLRSRVKRGSNAALKP